VYSTTVGLILARVFGMTLSMTIHGPDEFVNPQGFGMEEKIRAALFASAISCFGKSQIMLWSSPADWHKLEITPLGIDCDGWVPASFRERPAPFKLISVGRLAPVKGYALLLKAVAILTAQQRDVRLTLVGDGPEHPQLAQQAQDLGIADKVVFAGWKTQAELRDLYLDSELCVLSSFAEGIPVVFMEAMALGVPCVGPRITGIPELIRDGVDGLLVTPGNIEELADAIGKMMDKPEMRRQMALSSRERVLDKYNLHKNVAHLAELLSHYAGTNGDFTGAQS
jgi:glycosyltransferase involved in cell wall biosynthesis